MFLTDLTASPDGPMDGADVAVVLAHPDDETIGCGATLARLSGARVVTLTNGAPRLQSFAQWHGFGTTEALASARAAELQTALGLAGVDSSLWTRLGIVDQEVGLCLAPLARQLAGLLRSWGIRTVLTHAFEGGHPDHDAAAFAVHAAAALLGRDAPEIIEMPFYHQGPQGMVTQRFCDGAPGVLVELTPAQQDLKLRMMAAHATQTHVLADFSAKTERFRAAGKTDFLRLPNSGKLVYTSFACAFAADQWSPAVAQAMQELAL